MLNIEIIKYPQKPLSELYQSIDYKFSLVSLGEKGLQQCFPLVKCRDFLTDALVAHATGTEANIYKFTYSKENNPPINTSKLRLLVSIPKCDESQKNSALEGFNWALHVIHKLEQELGIKTRSKFYEVKNLEYSFLFVGPAIWLRHPVAISLYTLILRASAYIQEQEISFQEFTLEQLVNSLPTAFRRDPHANIFTTENVINAVKTVKSFNCRTFLSYYKLFEKDLQKKYTDLTGKHSKNRKTIVTSQLGSIHEGSGFMSLVHKQTYCSKTKECYLAILKENE